MSRIIKIDVADWDPQLRDMVHGYDLPPVARTTFDILAHSPKIAQAFAQMFGVFKGNQTLGDRLVELVRLRMAFHNQCRTCMSIRYQDGIDDGVTEDLVCSLQTPMEAPDLTEVERAALAYTDRFFNNHLSIDDSNMDELREHFTERQIVELNVWLALGGFGRMAAVFDMIEVLPEHFQDKSVEKLTPWNAPHLVMA